jgi:glutamate-1-semialdehyde 2,1-aminomutase
MLPGGDGGAAAPCPNGPKRTGKGSIVGNGDVRKQAPQFVNYREKAWLRAIRYSAKGRKRRIPFHKKKVIMVTLLATSRYAHSEAMLEQALRVIPLGSQTFSKSKTQYPFGVSPYFAERAAGSKLWDVDGNEYVDFVNSLGAVNLGYGDPQVDAAVRRQLEKGVTFSLSHPLEVEVAALMTELIPCAEMVRYGKNGSDATAGAVRLARAYTKRERIAVCGYHGWQDWYIGSTSRHLGVPQAVRELTHPFAYNDLASLQRLFDAYPEQIAGVILEPMSMTEPAPGFLEGVKELAHRHGAVLIFDETVTGFRFARGGAQERFGVVPDLAAFGKGMANGYPVSAVVGKESIMKLMEDIFFSFTFGGETLSLAAARATLEKIRDEPVTETLHGQGTKLMNGVRRRIETYGLGDLLGLAGSPVWSFLTFRDAPAANAWTLKTLFLQEMFARGMLTIGAHSMSYAHTDGDIERLLLAYDEVFALLRDALDGHDVAGKLRCPPLEPLFRVRG